jgi:hypothetical protein
LALYFGMYILPYFWYAPINGQSANSGAILPLMFVSASALQVILKESGRIAGEVDSLLPIFSSGVHHPGYL